MIRPAGDWRPVTLSGDGEVRVPGGPVIRVPRDAEARLVAAGKYWFVHVRHGSPRRVDIVSPWGQLSEADDEARRSAQTGHWADVRGRLLQVSASVQEDSPTPS